MNENRKEREEKKNKSNQIASRFEFYPMTANYLSVQLWDDNKLKTIKEKCIK